MEHESRNIPSAPCSQTSSTYDLTSVWETKFHTHTKQQVMAHLNYCSHFDWNLRKTTKTEESGLAGILTT
jgi:hypothetical protein